MADNPENPEQGQRERSENAGGFFKMLGDWMFGSEQESTGADPAELITNSTPDRVTMIHEENGLTADAIQEAHAPEVQADAEQMSMVQLYEIMNGSNPEASAKAEQILAIHDRMREAIANSRNGQRLPERLPFLYDILPDAVVCDLATRVPASIKMAQASLETGYGDSPTQGNNFFGIKGQGPAGSTSETTWEDYGNGAVTIQDNFRAYNNRFESFIDHSRLLTENPRYQGAMDLESNPDAMATELKSAGYATDPDYATKLQSIMRNFGLKDIDPLVDELHTIVGQLSDSSVASPEGGQTAGGETTGGETAGAAGKHTVQAGETLGAIAAQYNVEGGWRALAQHNGISNPNVLSVGQELNIPGAGGETATEPVAEAAETTDRAAEETPNADVTQAPVNFNEASAERFNKQQGYSRAQWRQIQETVGAGVDGSPGPETARKVAEWQRDNGLTVDGKVGSDTLGRISEGPTAEPANAGGQQETEEPASNEPVPQGNVTANFSWAEFACTDGTPVPRNLRGRVERLCGNLEILRTELGGKSITINSGYRTQAYNDSLRGSAKNSQHVQARAADIAVAGVSARRVADTIERLIRENKMEEGGLGRYNTFTHYDIRGSRGRWDRT